MTQLLPCPLCEGDAELQGTPKDGYYSQATIRCAKNLCCEVTEDDDLNLDCATRYELELPKWGGVELAVERVTARWNRRPAADAMSEEVERLREGIESCAALLEVIAEDAEMRGDTTTWAMASVMAQDARALQSKE